MALKKIRVHELSKELGLTSKELLTIAQKLGIGASSPSASIEDAQADRIRRRVDADGLRRETPPAEPAKATKATKATKVVKAAPVEAETPAPEVRAAEPTTERPPAPAPVSVDETPAPAAPAP